MDFDFEKEVEETRSKKIEREEESGYVMWLSELNKKSGALAGGKGANLAEMYNNGFPVPPAFVVTSKAFSKFISDAGLKIKIEDLIKSTNVDNTEELQKNASKIRNMIIDAKLPKELEEEIIEAYEILSTDEEVAKAKQNRSVSRDALAILENAQEPIFVAARSSATTEDLAEASFAGQQETYTNIKGKEELLKVIKKCFASLYTARAVYYRQKQGFAKANALLAVVVQKMINSNKSGVMFTKNPMSGKGTVIEAVFGLGEGIVSGKIKPDHYVIDKELEIKDIKIANKKTAIVRDATGKEKEVKLNEEKSKEQVLTKNEIISLAHIGQRIEEHYGKPQDIEFAIDNHDVFIVQSRPITTLGKIEQGATAKREISGEVLITGLGASPGIASGRVKVVHDMSELSKVKDGDVLVTGMTNPDMVVTMQKASAIVTDEGGSTAHAAIVSREMGIPCFSGDTKILTQFGLMNIEEVYKKIKLKENLFTLSFDLKDLKTEWKKISGASKKSGKTTSLSISKNGKMDYNELRTTEDHKFFTITNRNPSYKEIKDIVKTNKIVYGLNKIPPNKACSKLDCKKAYVCGSIFSDGYLRIKKDGSASCVFIQKKIEDKSKFIKTVKNYFNEVYDYHLKEVNNDYHYCYKKSIVLDLIKMQKEMHLVLLDTTEEFILHYLAGIIDGDGNFIRRGRCIKISLDQKKPEILHSLVIACLRLGMIYRIKKENNLYRFYICSDLVKLKPLLRRLKISSLNKTTGDVYLSSKELFSDISISGRKGIKSFVKNNCLISKREIRSKIIPYFKNHYKKQIEKILLSDLSALRVKNLKKTKKEPVYNIEVQKNHNYLVFSKNYTPILVKNCVVGTDDATKILKDGLLVTVDGSNGKVHEGATKDGLVGKPIKSAVLPVFKGTKTKIKVIVDLPEFADRAASSLCEDIGLVRLEGIIAMSGKHPMGFLKNNDTHSYSKLLEAGIEKISEKFKEIWIRASDIRSDEYSNLQGAPKEKELNPMLGFHGIRFSLKNPALLEAEISAIYRLASKYKDKIFGIMFPQVISEEEISQVYDLIHKKFRRENIKIGAMVETPAAVQIIRRICKYVKFISFGTNDLTQFTLAVDRGNSDIQDLYNEMHPAIISQLKRVIRICKEYNVETSICGQAGSNKDMVRFLVGQGIDSISVNADAAHEISKLVKELEENRAKNKQEEFKNRARKDYKTKWKQKPFIRKE